MLIHLPAVLDAANLGGIVARLDAGAWVDGRATVGVQGAQVKRNLQLDESTPLRGELAAQVLAALERHPLWQGTAMPLRVLPPRFNCYTGGGEYGMHVDGAVMRQADGECLRSDLSCTVFLNAPDDYDGGELIISDTYGEHEVKLAAGDAIVYPSSSLHQVRPVTRGRRLAAFFWVQSLVRDPAERELLLRLDIAIQQLRTDAPSHPSLLALTGVYHNLLRRWAHT